MWLQARAAWFRRGQFRHLLQRRRREIFAFLLLIGFASILLFALVPVQSRFETQIVATQVNFEIVLPANEPRRRFLDSIRDLESLTLSGRHAKPITLTGQFNSKGFGNLTELEIDLTYDYSQLQLKPIAISEAALPNELEVLALQLQDQTVVNALSYVPVNRRLELLFTHAAPPDVAEGSVLELYLGQQPLQLTLEGYRLSVAGQILEDPDGNQPLTFSFTPDIAELAVPLPQAGTLSLSLPPLANIDTLRWFWGNLPVTRVAFETEERRGSDALKRSTLSRGTVRMGEQKLDLEADQFLLLKKPGIQNIRYLRLIEDEGLEVRASGETSQAQAGLDPAFPVRGIRSNVMARFFRPDVVIAIVSFSGAIVATLLSWFIDNLFKPTNEDQ
jgi:hypothetical protein